MLLTPFLHKHSFRLIPGTCRLCRMLSGRSMELCDECEQALVLMQDPCSGCGLPKRYPRLTRCAKCMLSPPNYWRCLAPYSYTGFVRYLHHRFKFNQDLAAGQILSELITERILETTDLVRAALPDFIVPVPTHWWRRLKRGFDQTEIIAETLSARLELPLLLALRRMRADKPQQGLDALERATNVVDAFEVSKRHTDTIYGQTIALVDDVMTTGATAKAATNALLQGGAGSVEVWCLARALI